MVLNGLSGQRIFKHLLLHGGIHVQEGNPCTLACFHINLLTI
ncbi:hypothetical protein E2C01_021235 [Portunus trituberculatus]|uniref:Uncharacterized protein n=1 Tax=Portunus trituberculatus TaxID=210409 RepID=A0A5B7E233_PORTR|nr:hypothetical protein [Portunus trituberculatus]